MRLSVPAALVLFALPVHAQFWSELANPKVEVAVTHPPGLGLKIARLAFAPAADANSRELADALTADLVQSGQVEVVDRAHLDAVLKEQELGASGYIEPATIAKLGKLLGPSALVIVNVNRSDLSHTQATKEERSTDYKTKQEVVRLRRTSITSLDFSATVQVVDLSTGRVFGAQRLEDTPSLVNSSYDGWPAYPRDADVRRLAFETAKGKVLRMLLPWSETRKLTFFDDSVFGMDRAHERLKAGDLRGAQELAETGLAQSKADKGQKPKYYPRAYYNLGIIRFAQGQYDEALPLLCETVCFTSALTCFPSCPAPRNAAPKPSSTRAAVARAQAHCSGPRRPTGQHPARANSSAAVRKRGNCSVRSGTRRASRLSRATGAIRPR